MAEPGRLIAQAWLGSRLIIVIFAVIMALAPGKSFVAVANNWDADLYGRIARQGYLPEPNLMAFFPGLPLLMAGGLAIGIPTVATGVVVSLVGSALAAAALYRLARQGSPGVQRLAHWVPIAWLFAPTAVFTAMPYTESPFCAAAFWAWERAKAGKWGWAAVLAGVAASFRVSGVFLVIALAVVALTQAVPVRRRLVSLLWLGIPTAVVCGYFGYLYWLTGDVLAWYHAQANGWVRGFTWPWQAAINTWSVMKPGGYPDHPLWAPVFRFEAASMALGLIATVWCVVKRRWAEAVWVGIQVLAFSTSYWFYSVNRATLLWFPLWIMLIEWAGQRCEVAWRFYLHRIVMGIAIGSMITTMLWWCWLFYAGEWAS